MLGEGGVKKLLIFWIGSRKKPKEQSQSEIEGVVFSRLR